MATVIETADIEAWIEVIREMRVDPTEDEWSEIQSSGYTEAVREYEHKSGRKAAVNAIWALQSLLDAKRMMH